MRKALSIILLALTLVAAGVVISYHLNGWIMEQQYDTGYTSGWKDGYNYIKPPEEFQRQLVNMGYDIGTTGIDGVPGPNTVSAWWSAVIDQYNLWGFNPKIREFDKKMLAEVAK